MSRRLPAHLALIVLCLLAFTGHSAGPGATDAHAATSSAQRIVSIARAELRRGVRETPDGSNKGARIRTYGLSTSPRYYPAPWCAYFVSWVTRKAGRPIGAGGRGLGYVPYIRAWAKNTKRWKATPKAGDLIVFPQHVGIVETVRSNRTLTTIEGNSSNRVNHLTRTWGSAMGYVRVGAGKVAAPKPSKPKQPSKPTTSKLVARISAYPSTTVAVGQELGLSANDSSGDITRYEWDLDGDGAYDDAKTDNARRTYAKAGKVTIRLRVRNAAKKTATASKQITVISNQAPSARIELPDSAPVNTKVRLHADASDPDGRIVRYQWDTDADGVYGDGDHERSAVFTYPGTRTVGLRVTDDRGAVTETVATILITHKAPVARISGPSSLNLGAAGTYDAGKSYDPDGAGIASVAWDFGSDGSIDAQGTKANWAFAQPGSQKVTVTVTDTWGGQATTAMATTVKNLAPTARISAPALIVAGRTSTLDASSSTDPDSDIARYDWDLDNDGDFDDADSAITDWTPTGTGRRTVRLRVTDQWGATHTTSISPTLQQPPKPVLALYNTPTPATTADTRFTAAASTDADGSIIRLDWDLNSDGTIDRTTTSRTSIVAWRYTLPGYYTATLTVTDDDGIISTSSLSVIVR